MAKTRTGEDNMFTIFSKNKEGKVVETKLEPKRRIKYKSKVKMNDGFYAGQRGEVLEMAIETSRVPEHWSSAGYVWVNRTIQKYRVRLDDGNEAWVDAVECEEIFDAFNVSAA